MLPRWHIILGALFSLLLWSVIPELKWQAILMVFSASVLIDIDHYLCAVRKSKKWRLRDAFEYHVKEGEKHMKEHERGIRRKGDFHLFHTLEFIALTGLLGLIWSSFLYIFIGMIFHSILDMIYLIHKDFFYRREYFFSNWVKNS